MPSLSRTLYRERERERRREREREREREKERESGFQSLPRNSAVMKAAEIHMVGTGCCVIWGGVESVVVL